MAIDARRSWKILKPMLAGLWRLIGAALLAYLFILVLITASLQASVAQRLGNLPEPMDYSAGYSSWRDAERARDTARTRLALEERLAGELEAAQSGERVKLADWYAAMEPLFAVQRRLQSAPGCEFRGPGPDSEINTDGLLADLRTCVEQGDLPAAQRQAGLDVLARSAAISQAGREAMNAIDDRERLEARLRRARDSTGAASVSAEQAAASREFRELESFTRGRLTGAALLGDFPPAVVHILLAFFSGMFGALLVTLVLVVYPGNTLKLSTGGGGYEARIFLGGLISICVFVVLGGGTAVLGTSGGFGEGETNFLAFCAIGILAGMFSDRVAQWLSGRADAFFSRERQKPD